MERWSVPSAKLLDFGIAKLLDRLTLPASLCVIGAEVSAANLVRHGPLSTALFLAAGSIFAARCGARSDLSFGAAADGSGARGAGGSGATTSATSAVATSGTSAVTTSAGSGGGTFCPGLVVGGENALLTGDAPTRLALTEGSADGVTSVLAYAASGELRLIDFAPWNQWPEPLPGPQLPLSLQGGESFAIFGAPGDRVGAIFREASPGTKLVVTPTVDPSAPETAERFGLPIGERALAAQVRDDEGGRHVLAVFEEEAAVPGGSTHYKTRHAVATPPFGFTIFDPEACSTSPVWADALPVEEGFRMFTIGAPSSDGCLPSGLATALRAIMLDPSGAKIVLSYVDRMFPIDRVALAPTDEGALIVHSAIVNARSPLWLLDWHESTGTFGEPVTLNAPDFQGWGPIAAARVGPVSAVAYGETQDESGQLRVGVDIVSQGKSTAHIDIPTVGIVDGLALLGSPFGTALMLGYSTPKGEIRVLRIDCVGAL